MEPRVSRFEEALQIIHGLLRTGEGRIGANFVGTTGRYTGSVSSSASRSLTAALG
jgi:hypothetical protein